ncbi:MAG: sugar ABC transporter ATP-binding protein [Eubacterium sp.]|nr:sugar ABC transporter ATP-binding protein [Eubacterium sp.]
MKEKFLEISNVSKTFPGVKALDKVRFDICPGEVHALVGENGAGKSTLIKILSGVQPPDDGAKIVIEGQETVLHDPMDAIKKGISVIYQDFSLFTNLTVAENIGINEIIEKNQKILHWQEVNAKAEKALNFLKSDINPRTIVGNLSVAKQQMVAIATAVAQEAKMIIMDEPTSALSKKEVERLYEIIEDLKAQNIAIMFVGHKMEELFHVADRFTIFRDGQYVDTVNAKEVTESDLVAMMVGRKIEGKSYANLEEKGEEVLTVKGLSKKGNFKDINFTVRKGEVLGVTGLVGAGRSETAQAIFGLTSIDSGQVFIEGKEVHIKSPADALKMGIAYVPESRQTQGLVLPKTIRENILLPQLDKYANKLGILNNKEMEDATNKWIDMLDVRPNNPDLTAMSLSGGNQQKVVLAKWISTQAKVLIVDEPTNGVDIGAKDEIHKILRNLAKEGMAVIVISSELPEILTISDRIMVMRRGRVSGFLDNKDLTQEMIMKLSVA